MEEAIGQQLLQVGLHCALGEQAAVDAHALDLCDAVDLHARRILHCQHLLRCELPQHLGHLLTSGEVLATVAMNL